VSDWKAYTVIGTNVVIDCGTAEEAVAYERELWANQPYAPTTPAPLDVLVAARAVVDAWEETVTATVISRTNWAIERLRYALAATPAPLDVDRAAPFGDRISADLAQEASPLYDPEYMCPNCVTPWKCNGPHIPEE